jgi:cytochrome c oxidase subunit 2
MPQRAKYVLLAIMGFALLAGCGDDSAPDVDEGQVASVAAAAAKGGDALWTTCTACHGAQGEGNMAMQAPALINQDSWYLKRQLQHFKSGVRGAEPGDTAGAQMAAIAAGLPDDAAIDAVVKAIGSLSRSVPASTVNGDAVLGRDHYDMVCGACHGPGAQGNVLLNAPRLAGIDDWYLVKQYNNFAQGLRGSHPEDKFGRQMQMMSKALPDEKVINDVFAYIQSQAGER